MQDQFRNVAPVLSLFLFSTILGTYFVFDSPFNTLRQPAKVHRGYTHSSKQEIDARLWQDPLAVVHDSEHRKNDLSLDLELPRIIYQEYKKKEDLQLKILYASLPGGPYAEDGETRRRSRHAILAALAEMGYTPEDSEHIGAFYLKFPFEWQGKEQSVMLPYEFFQKSTNFDINTWAGKTKPKSNFEKVLIVWINDNAFSTRFIEKIKWLTINILGFQYTTNEKSDAEQKKPSITIIGPSSSDTLKAIINNQKEINSQEDDSIDFEIPITKNENKLSKDLMDIFKGITERITANDYKNIIEEHISTLKKNNPQKNEKLRNKTINLVKANLSKNAASLGVSTDDFISLKYDAWFNENSHSIEGGIDPAYPEKFNLKINIISSFPTAPAEYLDTEINNEEELRTFLSSGLISNFERTITTDKILAQLLVKEVKRRYSLREFKNDKLSGPIVLISEYDTLYGTALPNAFKNAWLEDKKDNNATETLNNENEQKKEIYRIGYLRGLDGIVPARANQSLTTKSINNNTEINYEAIKLNSQNFTQTANISGNEQPFGPSQLDYIRRLTNHIKQINREQGIRAIGILGSDPYDKQLILQSLRPRFPNAIFFTTDLDARILHKSQQKWSRNLIIASSYGLSLNRKHQYLTPPFRDVYQTSTFWATKIALFNKYNKPCLKGQLFEVGRNIAYNISDNLHDEHSQTVDPFKTFISKNKNMNRHKITIALILIAFTWFLAPKYTINKRKDWIPLIFSALLKALMLVIALYAPIYLVIRLAKNSLSEGEPLTLFYGISMWPVILLIIYALMISIFYLIIEHINLRKNHKAILNEFFSHRHTSYRTTNIRSIKFSKINKKSHLRPINNNAYHIYSKYASPKYSAINEFRAPVIWIVFYLLFIYDSIKPGRGSEILNAAEIIIFLSGLTITYLFVIALGHASRCIHFIEELAVKKNVTWHKCIIKKMNPGFSSKETQAIVNDLLDIKLIVARTKVISNFIIYPFIVVFIILISQNSFFDRWHPTPWTMIYITFFSISGLFSAFKLRQKAEEARAEALNQAGEKWRSAKQKDELDHQLFLNLIKEIKEENGGILAPWSRHPILKAILYPLGAFSTLALLDWWMLF